MLKWRGELPVSLDPLPVAARLLGILRPVLPSMLLRRELVCGDAQINRLKWQAGEHMSAVDANATLAAFAPRTALSCPAGCKGQAMTVELQPMEIRTFLLVPIFGLQWKS